MYNLNRQFVRRNNLKTPLYVAKKLQSTFDEYRNEIPIYDTPKKYFFNVQPAKNTSDVIEFGQKVNTMKVAVITEKDKYMGVFNEFDAAYLDGKTPNDEPENGFNANYRIYAVSPQNSIIKVYFQKIIEK